MSERLLTMQDLAQRWQVSRSTVYRFRKLFQMRVWRPTRRTVRVFETEASRVADEHPKINGRKSR